MTLHIHSARGRQNVHGTIDTPEELNVVKEALQLETWDETLGGYIMATDRTFGRTTAIVCVVVGIGTFIDYSFGARIPEQRDGS